MNFLNPFRRIVKKNWYKKGPITEFVSPRGIYELHFPEGWIYLQGSKRKKKVHDFRFEGADHFSLQVSAGRLPESGKNWNQNQELKAQKGKGRDARIVKADRNPFVYFKLLDAENATATHCLFHGYKHSKMFVSLTVSGEGEMEKEIEDYPEVMEVLGKLRIKG